MNFLYNPLRSLDLIPLPDREFDVLLKRISIASILKIILWVDASRAPLGQHHYLTSTNAAQKNWVSIEQEGESYWKYWDGEPYWK